jgi:hypothetical protein
MNQPTHASIDLDKFDIEILVHALNVHSEALGAAFRKGGMPEDQLRMIPKVLRVQLLLKMRLETLGATLEL